MDLANSWTIEGKDLISEVTCSEPYEWKATTDEEWEFSKAARERLAKDPFHVRPRDPEANLNLGSLSRGLGYS